MKKLLAGLFACVCVFVMAACGGAGANTPTAVAENYLSDLKAGNYEALVDQLYFKQEMSDTDKEQLVVMCKGKVEQTIEKNGELKGWEITSEEIAEDGKMGCAECYAVFYDRLLPSLNKIHGKTAYMGSKPQNGSVKTKTLTLQELKVALNEAVERQDFELAATLRDKINEIISEGGEL